MGMCKKWGSQGIPPKESDFGLAWYCGQKMPSQLQCHKAEGSEQHNTGECTVRGKEGLAGKAEKAEEKGCICQFPVGDQEHMKGCLSREGSKWTCFSECSFLQPHVGKVREEMEVERLGKGCGHRSREGEGL